MKGFDRTLKFAFWQGLKLTSWTLLLGVFMTIYFQFMGLGEEGDGIREIVSRFPHHLALIGCMYVFIQGMIYVFTYFQQQIAFGSTRTQAVLGMSLVNVVAIAIQLIIEAVVLLICVKCFGATYSVGNTLWLYFNGYLLAYGISMIVQPLVLKWGRIGYFVLFFSMYAIIGGVIGFLTAKGFTFGRVTAYISGNLMVTGVLIGIVILANLFMFVSTRKFEVKI